MKFSAFFLFLTFLSSALAVPFHALVKRELGLSIREDQHGGPGKDGEDSFSLDEHPWIPADFIKGASRSPCPFLNTMANHGFLKRDGRNLCMDDFENAMVNAVNFAHNFAHETFTVPQFRLLGVLGPNDNFTDKTINLEDLNAHGRNEHDASMSRLDKIQGNTLLVQPDLVQKILDDTVPVDYPFLNTSSIGRTRVRREKDSRVASSGEPSDATIKGGIVEGALALLFVGEGGGQEAPDKRFARKERLKEWMNFERIPYGWKRSEKIVTVADLTPLTDRVKFWRSTCA